MKDKKIGFLIAPPIFYTTVGFLMSSGSLGFTLGSLIVSGLYGYFSWKQMLEKEERILKRRSDDDENYYQDTSPSYSNDDDSSSHFINPASGAPMIDDGTAGVDTLGNSYGTDDDACFA